MTHPPSAESSPSHQSMSCCSGAFQQLIPPPRLVLLCRSILGWSLCLSFPLARVLLRDTELGSLWLARAECASCTDGHQGHPLETPQEVTHSTTMVISPCPSRPLRNAQGRYGKLLGVLWCGPKERQGGGDGARGPQSRGRSRLTLCSVLTASPDAPLLPQRNWQRPRKNTRAVTCPSPTRPQTEC